MVEQESGQKRTIATKIEGGVIGPAHRQVEHMAWDAESRERAMQWIRSIAKRRHEIKWQQGGPGEYEDTFGLNWIRVGPTHLHETKEEQISGSDKELWRATLRFGDDSFPRSAALARVGQSPREINDIRDGTLQMDALRRELDEFDEIIEVFERYTGTRTRVDRRKNEPARKEAWAKKGLNIEKLSAFRSRAQREYENMRTYLRRLGVLYIGTHLEMPHDITKITRARARSNFEKQFPGRKESR